MVVDLTAASGTKHLILVDPSSIQGLSGVTDDHLDPRLLPLANDGRALLIHVPRGDCEATIRVFVNEEPPADLKRAASRSRLSNFLLQVPSGVIEAAGAEDVGKTVDDREPGTFALAHLGAGTFLGDAFNTVRWKLRNRKRYVARRTSPLARRLRLVQNVAGFSGAVLIVGHILAVGPLIGMAFWVGGRRTGITALVALAVFDVLAWLFFYALDRASRTLAVFNEAREIEEHFERTYPDVVVSLTSNLDRPSASPGILVID